MKHFLKIVPIPICGLILGLTSLGNLLKDYHLTHLGNFVGAIGMLLMLLIIGKLILLFEHTKQHLYDPIVASVSPTFTMSLMVICTYFVSFKSIAPIVKLIWLAAVIFQIILVLYCWKLFSDPWKDLLLAFVSLLCSTTTNHHPSNFLCQKYGATNLAIDCDSCSTWFFVPDRVLKKL